MTLSNYYAIPYKIMTDEVAETFPFFGTSALGQVNLLIATSYGNRELIFDEVDATLQTNVQAVVKNVFDVNTYCWQTLKDSASMTYSPFEKTSIVESDTETNSGTDSKTRTASGSTNITVTPTTATTVSRRTYNNNAMTEEEKSANSGNETNAGTNSATETVADVHGHVITKAHSISGKDNVDYEAIIKAEREIAEFKLLEQIARTIVNTICLLYYNFDNEYSPSIL